MNRKKLTIGVVVAVVIIIIILLINLRSNGKEEFITVSKKDLTETIEISGRVEAGIISEIGFDVSGTIRSVFIKTNDIVGTGQSLVSLGLGTLLSELDSAKADLVLKETSYNINSSDGGTINEKQSALVESAYTKLLSEGLVAEASNSTYTMSSPVITGRYNGPEGVYKIIIVSEQTNEYELRTFDLESTKDVEISEISPTPLGTRGLFIEFPDDLEEYTDTIWYVNIPNKKTDSYLTNFNDYQEALREKNKESSSPVALAEISKARASVRKIETQIAERTLRAPFSGTITFVGADPGEAVGANEHIITIISDDLGVAVDLPEIDSVRVSVGDLAKVTFDSIDTNQVFEAKVSSVNRTETIVDGVPVYEARLILLTEDKNIISGMTAGVSIIINEKKDVLAIPARAVKTEKGKTFVSVKNEGTGEVEEVEIKTGIRGNDGFVEVVSGLLDGDTIVTSS